MKYRFSGILFTAFLFGSLLFCKVSAQNPSGDSLMLSGKVIGLSGAPLEGISVSIVGERTAPVLTDSSGNFNLYAPEGPKRLYVRSLDHADKEIYLEGGNDLIIYLSPPGVPNDQQDISYGFDNIRADHLVSPVEKLELSDRKYSEMAATTGDLMQGKVAGLFANRNSGMPGRGSYLMLRGPRSLNTSDQPLFIVDGIPMERPATILSRIEGNAFNPLAGISPLDISEITILKDAGSTALYGVSGANGVVLVSTLNPTATQTTIDLMIRGGITMRPRSIPQLNSAQFKSLSNELLVTSNLFEEAYSVLYEGLYLQPGELGYMPYQHDTQWQDEVFTNGGNQEVNLLVKGGDEISRYGLSVGYLNQTGNIYNTGFTRYNIRFTSFLRVYSWLEMNVNANLNNYNATMVPSALSKEASPILSSLFKSPILGPFEYDDSGNRLQTIAEVREFGVSNPDAVVNNSRSKNTNNRFILSINLKANVTAHLDWHSLFGLNLNSLKEEMFRPSKGMADYFGGLAYSYSEENTNAFNSVFTQHYLNYNASLGQQHDLSGSAGFRLQTNSLEHDWGRAQNLPDNDEFSELQSGDNSLRQLGGMTQIWNRMGAFASGNYALKDKYLASFNMSLDFTSRNGKESEALLNFGNMPLGFFYSVGAGWRLSNEAFLQDAEWLEKLCLRGSYGKAGNDDIGSINALNYFRQVRFRETSGLIPGTVPNLALKHEDSYQINAGVDLGIMGNRFDLGIDLFQNTTSDLFYYEPQLAFIGYQNRPSNGGEIRNRGVEFSLFTRIIDHVNITWDVDGNLTLLRNEVHSLNETLVTRFPGGAFISREGDQATSFYGYRYEGVYATAKEASDAGLLNSRGMAYGAGDAIFADISGPGGVPDFIIDDYDKVPLGSPVPDYFGALHNRVAYKSFSLDITLSFQLGNEVFNYVRYQNEQMTNLHNQSISTLNRWQREGDETDVPRALWNDPIGNSAFSSRWIEDGSYLRLRDLTLSYRIQDQFLVFRNAEFFLSALNLLTFSNYLGYDPEFSHSYQPMQQGIDYGLMPQTRQFIAGVKVGL